ncbi:MAG: hypothetical protein RXS23_09715 [Metallosphaera yellowstonensis]|jgi:hypothetical protein|uniref:C2H2-type domain-containing protein n=1 Tax=Metallosphaera yellowstonensis MK1 TaxID=671065 RepID=H2C357_9CREN|nr:hypothetical protein MetMK1DRAFT_00011810 [Metallosphaera yellowstonensis MK1]
MDSGVSITADKLVELAAKRASRIQVKEDEFIRVMGFSGKDMGKRVVDRVSFWIVTQENSLLYCRLCGKGPFTKRGTFLHLTRIHRSEIKLMLEEELRKEIKSVL